MICKYIGSRFPKSHGWFLLSLAFFVGISLPDAAMAEPDLDRDGDGTSDVLFTAATGQNLRWKSVPSDGTSPALDTEFGLASDLAIPGAWLSPDVTTLAYVRLDTKKNALVWKALREDGLLVERTFGKGNDYVIAGGDFDGNGITDAALMRIRPKGYRWTIAFDLFATEDSSIRRFKFGKDGDRVFYLSPEGGHDWLGILGLKRNRKSSLMTLRDPSSRAVKKIKLPKKLATDDRPRPFPVRLAAGTDGFGVTFQDQTDTTLKVYDLEGTEILSIPSPGLATVVSADFDGDFEGDEVALSTSTRLSVFNPETEVKIDRTPVAGTVVGFYKVQQVLAATPVPTAVPVATATIAPTATATPN